MAPPQYDVFISHANADKPGFVELLADRLRKSGIRVWYDDYEVGWGDSISGSIARGLAESRYGIVVLSRSFLRGGWARHELRGLLQREIHVGKTILPILHDISLDEIRNFDASLADMRALDTARHDLDQIVAIALQFLRRDATAGSPQTADLLEVHRLADVARLRETAILKYLERYGTAVRVSPGSGEAALGFALICLYLKRYSEAVERLEAAIRLLPASGKAHLYYALALLRGRRPRTLSLAETRQVLQALQTAASLDPREGLCDLLALAVKQEYFRQNGLRVPPPDLAQHRRSLAQKPIDADELAAIRCVVVLHDQSLLDARVR
jgi:tetratricopeptide (TPR) repeat protein